MSNARDIADAGHQLVAWVNFNGSASDSSLTIANNGIRSAHNVSSVSNLSTGNYKVNFDTDLSDVDYCFVGSAYNATNTNAYSCVGFAQIPSTTEFYVYVYDFSGSPSDVLYVYCAFFSR
ncbi:MAG: hypothetical protein CBC12_10710 [Candidatus Puniceispirillum sp. TMED52]|nr:MAG: hypothetical protein CBC12_10710 [Candidatus Puniceispirillum sp. TMED52]|tara:strand:- start:2512 stop:2871 length:360 start_codon:yes stop_codon:yes gene_type:complete